MEAKTRILDAAEEAFADAGLAGARVAAIAKCAGVNKAMLYYYFGCKEDLYVAVLERVFSLISDMGETALSSHEPGLDTLDTFLEEYRKIVWSRPHFPRLMMRELLNGGAYVQKVLGPRILRMAPKLAQAMTKGQAEGLINPDVHPFLVAPVMVSPFILFAFIKPVIAAITGLEPDLLSEHYRRTAREIVLHGLHARPAEET